MSATVPLWKKLEVVENPPAFLDSGDECYYAREYISHGGYKASVANNLIINFKKSPRLRGTSQWQHKEQAIRQFARELAGGLGKNLAIAPVPSSKNRTDPEYDSRLDDTFSQLKSLRPDLFIERPLEVRANMAAAHLGGSRKISEIAENLVWHGLSRQSAILVFIDDVLTTGAHYKACVAKAREHAPDLRIAGFFWARTVWPATDPTAGLDALPDLT